MATIQHSLLTGANIHEPKGVDTASANQVYVADGAGSGDWTTATWNSVYKLTTTSRANTTTLAVDPDLAVPMLASTKYLIRGTIIFDAAATPDLKMDWSLTDNITNLDGLITIINESQPASNTTTYSIRYESKGEIEADLAIAGNDTETLGFIHVFFCIQTNTNPNTLAFRWAQNTSNATATTVNQGSYLEYRVIS